MPSATEGPVRAVAGDAVEIARSVAERRSSAAERVDAALDAIDRAECAGAFWAVDGERALALARRTDQALARGDDVGPLAGVPLAVKDCFDVAGLPTGHGLEGPRDAASRTATVVARLRGAGAIPLGKTAMNPLGWSTDSEPPGWPRCANPRHPELATGGSSSGASAAVAAGIAGIGLGTDVAGSVRIPAAYCGIVGFKPARGATPPGGMARIVPSFDLAGVLARSVRDCRRAYEILASPRHRPAADGSARSSSWSVGSLTELFDAAEPEVSALCESALAEAATGLRPERTPLEWRPTGFGRILAIELARTWGDRVELAPERFTEDIRRSVAYGRAQTADAYRSARIALGRGRAEVARRLARFDVVASPTVPHPPPSASTHETVAQTTTLTRVFSALGWPALSVPCGSDSHGRPVAVQIAAHPRRLDRLFAVARLIERR